MHEMRPVAIDDPVAWCVCLLVCQSITRLCPAKTAKRIEVQFVIEATGGPINTVFNGVPNPRSEEKGEMMPIVP